MSPIYAESAEQRLFIQRWRLDPRTRDLPACAVPNAGRRGRAQAGIMKAEGMEPGVPDWLCFEPSAILDPLTNARYVGLALEFKSPTTKRKPTPAQQVWHLRLSARGWKVQVVYTKEEAWAAVCAYLGMPQ
ncbi:MAG: VRR-NUC domain-containing protein [Burkholderiales bacterium]|nr:VRR-NUC domain-containing protein [Burkholderiales bacterium]